jgi:hypothetical protein
MKMLPPTVMAVTKVFTSQQVKDAVKSRGLLLVSYRDAAK